MTLLPLEVDHERRQDRVVSGVRPDRLRVDHVDHAYERVAAAPPHVLIRVLVALQAAMLLPPALAPLQAAAARLDRPLVTQTLVDADHRLGFDWVAYSTWLHASWLSDPTRWAYLAYAPLMAATLVGLAVVDWRRAVRFYGAVGAALLAAFAVFATSPTTPPAPTGCCAHGASTCSRRASAPPAATSSSRSRRCTSPAASRWCGRSGPPAPDGRWSQSRRSRSSAPRCGASISSPTASPARRSGSLRLRLLRRPGDTHDLPLG